AAGAGEREPDREFAGAGGDGPRLFGGAAAGGGRGGAGAGRTLLRGAADAGGLGGADGRALDAVREARVGLRRGGEWRSGVGADGRGGVEDRGVAIRGGRTGVWDPARGVWIEALRAAASAEEEARYFLGLDLGQAADYTALAIVRRVGDKEARYEVVGLRRF